MPASSYAPEYALSKSKSETISVEVIQISDAETPAIRYSTNKKLKKFEFEVSVNPGKHR